MASAREGPPSGGRARLYVAFGPVGRWTPQLPASLRPCELEASLGTLNSQPNRNISNDPDYFQ